MKSLNQLLTRRKFFHFGVLGLGALSSIKMLAKASEVCDPTNPNNTLTGNQPLGPFFPKPSTPIDPIREDQRAGLPIYLANDNDLTVIKGRSDRSDQIHQAQGQVIRILGSITDKNCNPIPNVTLIIWQASSTGHYNHKGDNDNVDFRHPKTGKLIHRTLDHNFQYWGKDITNDKGEFTFKTIIPGFYPADLDNNWYRPPHIHYLLMRPGSPQFITQMYFSGKDIGNENQSSDWIHELNKKDLLLQSNDISNGEREKLIVEFKKNFNINMSSSVSSREELVGRFDIVLQ